MKPQYSHFAMIAGGALCFVSMMLIGWEAGSGAGTIPQPAHEKPSKLAERTKSRHAGPPDAARQRMASIRALGTPAERMRATIAFANSLPASEIGAWMDGSWFGTGEGFDLTLFEKILKERWKNEDPMGMLAWSVKNNSSQAGSILASWANEDPQKLVDFFMANPNKDLQARTLSQIAEKNPAAALKCLLDLGVKVGAEEGSNYYYRELFKKLAAASTGTLEAALASLSPALKAQAESALAAKGLETSFTQEIQKLWKRPDGWKLFYESISRQSNESGMADKLFDQLANLPDDWKKSLATNSYNFINEANYAKWWNADLEGMGFSDKQAKRIRENALSQMSSKQPADAIKLIMSDPELADNKSSLIRNLFSNISSKDTAKVESLIAMLGSEEDRKAARDSLSVDSEQQELTKIDKPADWLAKIGGLDPNDGNGYQYFSMIREWDEDKFTELGNQFSSMPDEQKQQVAQVIVNSGMSGMSNDYRMPLMAEAIRYMVASPIPASDGDIHPQDRYSEKASSFTVQWGKKDPVAASAWVRTLPAGESRSWAQKNLAVNWALYDPQEANAWVNSLPANERTEVQAFMKDGTSPRN